MDRARVHAVFINGTFRNTRIWRGRIKAPSNAAALPLTASFASGRDRHFSPIFNRRQRAIFSRFSPRSRRISRLTRPVRVLRFFLSTSDLFSFEFPPTETARRRLLHSPREKRKRVHMRNTVSCNSLNPLAPLRAFHPVEITVKTFLSFCSSAFSRLPASTRFEVKKWNSRSLRA